MADRTEEQTGEAAAPSTAHHDEGRVSTGAPGTRGAVETTAGTGANCPAIIRPSRNATTAVSATETAVNRLDMVCAPVEPGRPPAPTL